MEATAAATVRSQVPVIVQETRHAAIQHTVPAGNATTAPAGTAAADPLCDKLGPNARSKGANVTGYIVLGPAVWSKTLWGRNCSNGAQLHPGQQGLCHLPQIWKNCTQGIYLDLVSHLEHCWQTLQRHQSTSWL